MLNCVRWNRKWRSSSMKLPKRSKLRLTSKASEGRASARPKRTRPRSRDGDVQKHVPPRRTQPLRPFVFATFAMTVDGKITTRTFSPVDFTSREDKLHLLRKRSLGDAVLIGHGT